MIKLTKHNHRDQTIIGVSFLILKKLRQKRVMKYDDLLKYIKIKVSGGDLLFLPSLNFLYLFDTIAYHKKLDTIEYIRGRK